jgi:hypothetical protein
VPPEQLPRLAGGNKGGGLMYAGHLVHAEKLVKQKRLKAPFPAFGGKSRVADLVWRRLGDVSNFIEPFFFSGAVLLRRPHPPRVETANDLDCYIANFWRATQHDPEAVAFRERMRADPDHYDPKIAGWWCWGACCWIGSGWCASPAEVERNITATPALMGSDGKGQGVVRKRPHQSQQMPRERGRGDAAAGPGLHNKRPRVPREHRSGSGGTMPGVHGRPQLADAYSRGRGVHGTDAADRYLGGQYPTWEAGRDWPRARRGRRRPVLAAPAPAAGPGSSTGSRGCGTACAPSASVPGIGSACAILSR